ncbi:Zn(II)2Cys6 transcription factor domain-containing protein [Phanerochaete sordida]|uniref:Zn(II)2Cys6 transcription factor domain-containing protein n=1 Tax=Phanerochaete sordida TaxID=48140 RepID=A0A9P3GS80_9APHY|nr:Zn(II)2Cys6 transcription factor domain-containing protein [Phanerochaete sordida]
MSQTCVACRTRKMRCDGETPVCGPCSRARKPVDCTYSKSAQNSPKTVLLPKGAACLPCRRKKKKCDAKRPFCHTCRLAGKELDCEYDDELKQNFATALLMRTQELEERLSYYESRKAHMSQSPEYRSDHAMDLDVPSVQWREFGSPPLPGFGQGSFAAASPTRSLHSNPSDGLSAQWHTASPFTQTPISDASDQGADRLGLVCQSTYQLRALFLSHQIQLGFYLRETKRQAVLAGDLSGRIVHPAVIHLAQLVGTYLWTLHHKTDVLVVSEDVELLKVLSALEYAPEPATLIMIYTVLGEYFLYKRQIEAGRPYLVKASKVLSFEDLQLSTPSLDALLVVGEPDEDTKEYLTALGQLAYIDKATSMVIGLTPFLDDEYEKQLQELALSQPWFATHSAVAIRCKSLALLREALRLSRARAAAAGGSGARLEAALPLAWYTAYWAALEESARHLALLYPQMLQASLHADLDAHTLCLKTALVVALAAQIELHALPGFCHAESRQKALSSAVEVVGLTRGWTDQDYAMLEPTLGICYRVVANALRDDRRLYAGRADEFVRMQEALAVLITSATRLAAKVPYLESTLQTLQELARGS